MNSNAPGEGQLGLMEAIRKRKAETLVKEQRMSPANPDWIPVTQVGREVLQGNVLRTCVGKCGKIFAKGEGITLGKFSDTKCNVEQ